MSNTVLRKYQTNFVVIILLLAALNVYSQHSNILVEAESFDSVGGWVVDPQFVEQMGSPYLMAHGMGELVLNAKTTVNFSVKGEYFIWARTINWAPGAWQAPGRFNVLVNNVKLENTMGLTGGWSWEYAGSANIKSKTAAIELADLTGFNGRCDALYFSMTNEAPPESEKELSVWRQKMSGQINDPDIVKNYDLVVVGGGLAGCAAAIAAAEQGLDVALIHDRPLLGGNASSEIRVHTEGIYGHYERILKMLDTVHYPNGSPDAEKDQQKRQKNMQSYENIHLFLNWRAYDAHSKNSTIQFVDARHTFTGERLRFMAPNYVDCTGDGWIGYWAGAEYMYGRESVHKFGEAWEKHGEIWSPEVGDNAIMGSSVLWRTFMSENDYEFPAVLWAMEVAAGYAATMGTWNWEYTNNDVHQIEDAEEIRDHMLKAIFGAFANAKQNSGNKNLKLEWISYLVGKRESRRLVGDYIYTFSDAKTNRTFPDSAVVEERSVDVHFQQNLLDENKPDFLSEALFYNAGRYYLPYRTLYSKNINNLFMAGRCFSCSHIGLGGPRVMLTTGQMGAAVGYAASLCKKYKSSPRDIYTNHLDEYMNLILSQK
jgi:hypothetical protein